MASLAIAVAAFVVIAIIASVTFAQDPYNPTGGVNTLQADSAETNPTNGLSLRMSINATTITTSQAVNITVGDYNILSTMENVSASSDWPLKGLNIGPCGSVNAPFGVEVYRGSYDASTVSSAKALQLYNPNALYACPAILSGITQYSYYPQSSVAQIWGSCSPEPGTFRTEAASVDVNGFWNTVPLAQYSYRIGLTPGVYTVAAGDEWGHLLLLHFMVKS